MPRIRPSLKELWGSPSILGQTNGTFVPTMFMRSLSCWPRTIPTSNSTSKAIHLPVPPQAGYPGFRHLVEVTKPHQVTLVPDSDEQLTSDHGWDLAVPQPELQTQISAYVAMGCRVSLFMDPVVDQMAARAPLAHTVSSSTPDRMPKPTGLTALTRLKLSTVSPNFATLPKQRQLPDWESTPAMIWIKRTYRCLLRCPDCKRCPSDTRSCASPYRTVLRQPSIAMWRY